VTQTEVFRFAAPCAGERCQHFDNSAYQLARLLQDMADKLPACSIRPSCRWWL
jgi:hypothetical protein